MPATLATFHDTDLAILRTWLHRPHVAPWYPEPDENLAWAEYPPWCGSHTLIAHAGKAVGYIRCQVVDRPTDSVGLHNIPTNAVDVDLLLGKPEYLGRGIGPEALRLLVVQLRANPSLPMIGLTSSAANVRAQRSFEKAGFRFARHNAPPGFGPCYLFVLVLKD